MNFLKRQLPVLIAFLAGIVFWLQYYVPSTASQNLLETFNASWAIILAGAAFILGMLSSVEHHWSKVTLRKAGWGYSVVALLVFGTMLQTGWVSTEIKVPLGGGLVTSWGAILSVVLLLIGAGYLARSMAGAASDRFSRRVAGAVFVLLALISILVIQPLASGYILAWKVGPPSFTAQGIKPGSLFMWFFDNCFVPLDATMFSLLAFYIASAAFRAFRARSFEATALLIAGCLVMIGRVPIGELLSAQVGHWTISIKDISGWIMNSPNAAAQRGILLGVILSQIAISLRIIFGIERTYMGGGD